VKPKHKVKKSCANCREAANEGGKKVKQALGKVTQRHLISAKNTINSSSRIMEREENQPNRPRWQGGKS